MRRKHWLYGLWACFLFLGISATFASDLPDHTLTPGSTNPNVTQDNINKTICVSGWTKTIRPTTKYTNELKQAQIKEYGYKDKSPTSYEEDHLISLQLGGHPIDPKNLWPEPYNTRCGARIKDVLETRLKKMVCANKIPLADAQTAIATDWIKAYKKYVHGGGCPFLEHEQ